MAGLDGILDAIQKQADERCAAITKAAEREAEAMRAAAREQAENESARTLADADAAASLTVQKAQSAAEMDKSRALLQEKVTLVNEATEQALAKLAALDDAAYARALISLAARFAMPGAGVMQLAAADKPRLPASFETDLAAALAAAAPAGATLTIETVDRELGGCLLLYGDVVQNCTFAALADDMKEALNDEIGRVLFG